MSADGGGNAFPQLDSSTVDRDGDVHYFSVGGMTLRDYFAGKAIAEFIDEDKDGMNPDSIMPGGASAAQVWARKAYEVADAMLAERSK